MSLLLRQLVKHLTEDHSGLLQTRELQPRKNISPVEARSLKGVGHRGIRGEAGIGSDRVLVWSNNNYIDGKPPEQFPITVKALDSATGATLWFKDKAQPAVGWSGGFLANDVFFVGSLDGTLKAYSAEDGRVLWTGQAPAAVGSPLVVTGDTLLVGYGIPKAFGGVETRSGVAAFRPAAGQ